jgi:rod shape-determining protein MreB
MGLFNVTDTLGIDPGSRNLRIFKDGNVIFDEPALISVDSSGKMSGLGNTIATIGSERIIKPVTYAVGDFVAFEELLKGAIEKTNRSKSFIKSSLNMYFCIPPGTTVVERRAYRDAGEMSGASHVYLVEQCFSASIGMGILFEKKDYILIDFGADKIEMTLFCDSKPVESAVLKLGLQKIMNLVKHFLQRKHQLNLSDAEILTLLNQHDIQLAKGKVQIESIEVELGELDAVLAHYFFLVNDEMSASLERLSKQHNSTKLRSNGIYFTGGGSAIESLRKYINPQSDLRFQVSKSPLLDNIHGLGKLMTNPSAYKDYILQ